MTVACADSTNTVVRVAGSLRSTAEIVQLILVHARRAQMQFDFAHVQPHFTVLSNTAAVVSMWCAQTNGAYFYATVDSRGKVWAQEILPRDAESIRAVVARQTTNTVTQVWLSPEGRVGATTIRDDPREGELFWLERVGTVWRVRSRGSWKSLPPAIPSPDIVPTRDVRAG